MGAERRNREIIERRNRVKAPQAPSTNLSDLHHNCTSPGYPFDKMADMSGEQMQAKIICSPLISAILSKGYPGEVQL
jgi:hypothetical protein